jgi:hypothetical protein
VEGKPCEVQLMFATANHEQGKHKLTERRAAALLSWTASMSWRAPGVNSRPRATQRPSRLMAMKKRRELQLAGAVGGLRGTHRVGAMSGGQHCE